MKNLILILSLFLATISTQAQNAWACITNITIHITGDGHFFNTNGSYFVGETNVTGDAAFAYMSDACQYGPCIQFCSSCATAQQVIATVSWECNGICGTHGSFAITMPAFTDYMLVWIYPGAADCSLEYCRLGTHSCMPNNEY